MIVDLISWALLLAGSFFCLVGAAGLMRMPDFFCRVHGAGVLDTLGTAFIVLGLVAQAGVSLVTLKLLLILALLWITGPTAMNALARAAVRGKLTPMTGPSVMGSSVGGSSVGGSSSTRADA